MTLPSPTATTSATPAAATKPRCLDQMAVACYREHGYALPGRQLLPATEFTDLRAAFDGIEADWLAKGGRPEHLDVPHFYYPELMRWLLHDAVLDVVEDLIGPDIALFSSHFISKPAGDGKRVPWHEDSAYWKTVLQPMEVVTIWLAIDPSTPENGCMKVIPDSHRHGYSEYDIIKDRDAVFEGNIKRGQFDESTAVDCVLDAGEYSLHHAKTIHGSAHNHSSQRRCGYTMRYVSTRSRFNAAETHRQIHQIYLARGVDHAGNDYADPTQPYQAWIDRFGFMIPKGH